MSRVHDAFAFQSKACVDLGSPFMGRLMALFAERLAPGGAVADRLLDWPGDPHPGASSLPLRTAGALHGLVLRGHAGLALVYPPAEPSADALWTEVARALDTEAGVILPVLASAPQTNEVRRAVAILPGLHMVAARFDGPFDLIELGCSAGLNLFADLFTVETPTHRLGPAGSPVALAPDWTGPAPAPAALETGARTGIDLSPIDPRSAEGALRLLSYVWPDQPDRLASTEAAIGLAAEHPAEIIAGDAGVVLEDRLSRPVSGRGRVIFNTVAWQYFPDETAARASRALARAGKVASQTAPLVHIAMEADGGRGAALTLTAWPGGETHTLARVDFHGRWIDWTGPTSLPR